MLITEPAPDLKDFDFFAFLDYASIRGEWEFLSVIVFGLFEAIITDLLDLCMD